MVFLYRINLFGILIDFEIIIKVEGWCIEISENVFVYEWI